VFSHHVTPAVPRSSMHMCCTQFAIRPGTIVCNSSLIDSDVMLNGAIVVVKRA
jgi:hypothetical protein